MNTIQNTTIFDKQKYESIKLHFVELKSLEDLKQVCNK